MECCTIQVAPLIHNNPVVLHCTSLASSFSPVFCMSLPTIHPPKQYLFPQNDTRKYTRATTTHVQKKRATEDMFRGVGKRTSMKAKLIPIACAANAVRSACESFSCAAMHGTAAAASNAVTRHSIDMWPHTVIVAVTGLCSVLSPSFSGQPAQHHTNCSTSLGATHSIGVHHVAIRSNHS